MTKLVIILFSLFAVSVQQLTPDDFMESFNSWLAAYGKSYPTQAQQDAAYQNYLQVVTSVAQYNGANQPHLYEQPVPPIATQKKRGTGPAPVTLSVNALSDVAPSQFAALYGGAIIGSSVGAGAAAGGAALATIIGGVVGGVVGVAAIAAGVGGVVYYKKKKSSVREEPNPTYAPQPSIKKGVDVYNFDPATTTSITARAPPKVVV